MGNYVEVDKRGQGDARETHDAEELESALKEVFGSSALTTHVEDEGDRVSVKGDGWGFVVRRDGTLVFEPGGTAYRIVRSTDALETVEQKDDGGVSFVFADESITLSRGVEHRA
jgi:superoxide dismutase